LKLYFTASAVFENFVAAALQTHVNSLCTCMCVFTTGDFHGMWFYVRIDAVHFMIVYCKGRLLHHTVMTIFC